MSQYLMTIPNKDFIISRHMNIVHTFQAWADIHSQISKGSNDINVIKETTVMGKAGLFIKCNNEAVKIASVPVSFDNVVFDNKRKILWYGFSSQEEFLHKAELDSIFEDTEITVLAVALSKCTNLTRCFNLLADGTLIWTRSLFDTHSASRLDSFYPVQICLNEFDTENYVSSGIQVSDRYVCGACSDEFKQRMSDLGYAVEQLDMSEWHSHGLTMKCLVNQIIE
jgi:hypothetical protein